METGLISGPAGDNSYEKHVVNQDHSKMIDTNQNYLKNGGGGFNKNAILIPNQQYDIMLATYQASKSKIPKQKIFFDDISLFEIYEVYTHFVL